MRPRWRRSQVYAIALAPESSEGKLFIRLVEVASQVLRKKDGGLSSANSQLRTC